MAFSSLQLSVKLRNNNNYNDYNDDDNDKDVMIASTSKKNDNHNTVSFALVMVAAAAAGEGVIHPRRCLLTLTLLRRRRGRDPSLLKWQSTNNNKDNMPQLPVQARMTRTTCGHCWGCGQRWSCRQNLRQKGKEAKVEVQAEATSGDATTSQCKQSGGARINA